MFGKRSSTDNFVMSMGRKAGNIKTAKAPAAVTKQITPQSKPGAGVAANSHKKVATPNVTKAPMKGKSLPTGGSGAMTNGLHTAQFGKMSLGKANTFKVEK